MKRETMKWLHSKYDLMPRWAAMDILDELKRLRRENRELRATCRLAVDELNDVNGYLPASLEPGGHVHEALKKGGRK